MKFILTNSLSKLLFGRIERDSPYSINHQAMGSDAEASLGDGHADKWRLTLLEVQNESKLCRWLGKC